VNLNEPVDIGYKSTEHKSLNGGGTGKPYIDYLLFIYKVLSYCIEFKVKELQQRGKTMQFWADVVIDKPSLLPLVPKDATCLLSGSVSNIGFCCKSSGS
jgi:hypothetical protein